MASVNLIPDNYRQDVSLRRMVRNFILACVLVLLGIGLAKALLSYLIWRENVQVVLLEQQEQASQQNKSKTEEFRQQKQVTEQQLSALQELRGGDRVTLFLHAIDHAYNEGVWFDSIRFMRRNGSDVATNLPNTTNNELIVTPTNAEATQTLEVNHGAEIIGHAMNHTVLAEFMRQLGAQQSVADLRLIDTSTRNYTTIQVIDFNIDLKMNTNITTKNSEPVLNEKVQVQP